MQEPTEPTQFAHTEKADAVETPEAKELSAGEKFSQDLDTINAVIATLLRDDSIEPAVVSYAWNERADTTEAFIASIGPTPDSPNRKRRLQFDIMVDKALIFERVGSRLRFFEELEEAECFAKAADLYEILPSLTKELDDGVLELGDSLAETVMKQRGQLNYSVRCHLMELLVKGMSREDLMKLIPLLIEKEKANPTKVQFFLT